MKCEGIGGPELNCPKVSKLEYADNIGLLNEKTVDASIRTSSLTKVSTETASMEISLKKTKGMPIRMPTSRLIRETINYIGWTGPPYEEGSILMECNEKVFNDLLKLAADIRAWERSMQRIDSLHESLFGA